MKKIPQIIILNFCKKKQKEKKIIELESQIENLNQEIIGTNQKNMKLQSQINSSQKIKDKNLLKPHKAT